MLEQSSVFSAIVKSSIIYIPDCETNIGGEESMEHRCDHRKLLSLEIVLNDHDVGELRGKTRNVSLSGMLVDIGETPMRLNTIIDISFPVVCGEEYRSCKAKAFVVHQQSGSLGLMFSEIDSDVRQMLRKLLFGYATVSERAFLTQRQHEVSAPSRAVA
jgi:hypothetical protein